MIPQFVIEKFVKKHSLWIEKKQKTYKEEKENNPEHIQTESEMRDLKHQAKVYIPQRVEYLAKKFAKKYNKIKITSAKTRWGSCTSQKNLNFSYRLIGAEKEAIDYVIIHELAHLKYMNHSKIFWNHVWEMMPDYKKWDSWLKNEGRKLW